MRHFAKFPRMICRSTLAWLCSLALSDCTGLIIATGRTTAVSLRLDSLEFCRARRPVFTRTWDSTALPLREKRPAIRVSPSRSPLSSPWASCPWATFASRLLWRSWFPTRPSTRQRRCRTRSPLTVLPGLESLSASGHWPAWRPRCSARSSHFHGPSTRWPKTASSSKLSPKSTRGPNCLSSPSASAVGWALWSPSSSI